MDALTQAALIGTARAGNDLIASDDAIAPMLDTLVGLSAERRLLLQAGATAIYHAAGQMAAADAPALPPPAPAETTAVCSPPAASLLHALLAGEHEELLPEALERLRLAGQILPPELLPSALGQRNKTLRPALLHVVGERGRWLSQFNAAWSWVTTPLVDGDALPPDAEVIWEEGRLEQRQEILRRLRHHDPATARDRLAAVWSQERADARVDLLAALATNLSADDIPWLESIKADRSERVRQGAAQLLAMIPASAVAQRLCQRAAAMVSYAPGALTGTPVFTVNPPKALDAATAQAWQQDGLTAAPPSRGGKRAWWLFQSLSHVPPTYWEEQWYLTPTDLLALASQNDYARALIEGWSTAAATFASRRWASPLLQWWLQHPDEDGFFPAYHYVTILQPMLAAPEQAELASGFFTAPAPQSASLWVILLRGLPQPWSTAFSRAYLVALRDFLAHESTATANDLGRAWMDSLLLAARGIATAAFPAVSDPFGTALSTDAQFPQLHSALDAFTETLAMRRRLAQEIR